MTLVVMAGVAVIATYDGWDRRELARGAEPARKGDPVVARYKWAGDSIETIPHQVVYLEPESPAVAPPPGIPRWPKRGEVFLSPELIRAGAAEGITRRYGEMAGTIEAEGLATPSERLAYVRPVVTDHRGWFEITRIGSARATPMGDTADRVSVGQLLSAIGFTFGGAAIVLLVVAARCGSTARDRRLHLLAALGAGRRHRTLMDAGEAVVPLAIGTALGAVPYAVMSAVPIRVPVVDQVAHPADLREWAGSAAIVAVAVLALMLCMVMGLHRYTSDGKSTRPRTFADAIPRWRLYAGLLALVAIVAAPYLPKVVGFLAYVGGTALLWGMLPSAVGVAIRRWGGAAAAYGRRVGWGAALIAGRWTQARPGVVVRVVAVVVIGLGVVTQAQVWSSRLGDSGQNAQLMRQRLQDSVLVVTPQSGTPTALAAFRRTLPDTAHAFPVTRRDASVLHGSCPDVTALGIACPTRKPRLADGDVRAEVLGQYLRTGNEVEIRETPGTGYDEIAVVSPLGTTDLAAEVKQTAREAFGMAKVARPYDSWLLGSQRLVAMADWVRLLTVLTLGVLALAMAFSSAAEFLVFTTAVAPLAVLNDRRRFLFGTAVWNLTLPTTIALIFGAAVAAWQGLFFIAMSNTGVFSWPLLLASTAGALVLAVSIGLAAGVGAVRSAAHWRPATD
ncbi:FtsX-like permease family protein [Spongiactinospora sp. 9N601]|uniref:FtsX-like permease family protein n=1 Tax=Spongiactinospora sp. 9N601 TaxID=3375149 RepID=UPI0037A8B59D